MADVKHTPGPWVLGEYSETLGYDCMTGGIKAGPVYLDAAQYGQQRCSFTPAPERMLADARLIAAAPDLLAALTAISKLDPALDSEEGMNEWGEADCFGKALNIASAAISKATGEA